MRSVFFEAFVWICIIFYSNRNIDYDDIAKDIYWNFTDYHLLADGILFVLLLEQIKKRDELQIISFYLSNYYARSTLPDFKQDVQTYIFLVFPPSVFTLTDFTLDFHILGVFLLE